MENYYHANGPWAQLAMERRHEVDDITFDQLNFFLKNVYGFADSCQPGLVVVA
jgi:hypothetical protein